MVSRTDVLKHVWNAENDGQSRAIDTHIRRLRVKLGAAGRQIECLTRIGYRFNEDQIGIPPHQKRDT